MARQTVRPELRYSEEHEWVDSSSPARVGISAVAADALGEVVFAELPEVGGQVSAGQVCGELESTKAVSDLYSPVSGTVVAVNEALEEDPSVINTDPYGAGWLFTVEVSGEGELLSAEDYAERFDAEVLSD
ncbi:MAG: glycine cleavage system protein GcvH [Actinomyces bowdenii]|nr:glycine cleavage system protein GcvH [Actinomyces bowdenii]